MGFTAANRVFEDISVNYLNGMPVNQIRLVVAFLIVIPLGYLFTFLHGKILRQIVGTSFGVALWYLVYSNEMIHVILNSIIVYVLILVFKRNSAIIVFVESLVFLSGHHIYRQYVSYGKWDIDITTVLMMSVCKWTSFAWNYQDGGKESSKLSKDQELRKLKKLPNFFDYFSFISFFGSSVCGPNSEYYDFDLFIKQQDVFANIPFTLKESMKWLGYGTVCSLSTVFLMPKFPLSHVRTQEYFESSQFHQLWYFNVCIVLMRVRYYAGWCLSQAGLSATGASFNGKDENGENKWDRILSCIPQGELSYDMRYKVECWNSSVQVWLKKYVYLRVSSEESLKSNPKKAQRAQYITNAISAFWHGFYPGYYITFFCWSLVLVCGKQFHNASINKAHFFKKIRSIVSTPVFVVVRFLMCNILLNVFGIGFQLLDLESGHNYYKAHYYFYLIILLTAIAFFSITGWGQRAKKQSDDKAKLKKDDDDSSKNTPTPK